MNALDEARARRDLPAPPLARAIREAAGVSQAAIGRTLDVNRMTVSRWESGSCRPSGKHLFSYSALLRALSDTGGEQ